MGLIQNLLRVALGMVWTIAVGIPLLLVIWVTYLGACLASWVGRDDLYDDIIEWNAGCAGRVAQTFWSPVILALCRADATAVERASIDWRKTHIVCANHASIFDIIALVHVLPPPYRFVAKKEILRWPIIGWALRPAGQIVVDRADPASAIQSIEHEAGHGIHGQIIFFVEGTRSRDGHLRPFKKGAFHFAVDHDIPVVPTAICGSHGVLARTAWWRIHPGHTIRVVFGDSFRVDATLTGAPKAERVGHLLSRTRRMIADELGEPFSANGVDPAVETAEENRSIRPDGGR